MREPKKNIGYSLKNAREEKEEVGQKEAPITANTEKKEGKNE